MLEWHLLHPIAVHFPIVLLNVGLAAAVAAYWLGKPAWLYEAVPWLLGLGTASAWAALGLGLLAEKTAPHVPAAWKTLNEHEELAYWTAGLFTALSLWRLGASWVWPSIVSERRWRLALIGAWALAAGVLAATAYHGGELVYVFGMGISRGACP